MEQSDASESTNGNGDIPRVTPISVVSDIRVRETDHAITEAQLALSEEFGGAYPFVWNARTGDTVASDAFKAFFGVLPHESLNAGVMASRVHFDDRARLCAHWRQLLEDGGSFESEYRVVAPDGAVRWILARGRVLMDDAGRPDRLAGVNLDISGRKETELALANREARVAANEEKLRGILNAMPQMVWSTRSDGFHDFYNDRWYEFTGVAYGSTDGEDWNGMFHPEDQERAWARWRHSLATGAPYEIEYRLRHRSGAYRWTLGRALPVRGEHGAIERWLGTCTDIHDLKTAEEQRELIANELSHRIQNIFAVVSSLVVLSAKTNGDPAVNAFATSLGGRLKALGKAHDFVRPHSRESEPAIEDQSVRALLATLLAAYQEGEQNRVSIAGGDMLIGANAATSLALIVHELATNAVKYGALSVPRGEVRVSCADDGDTLRLNWQEQGGPHVEGPPKRAGFGTTLSSRVAAGQLDAVISYDWAATGVRIMLTFPLNNLRK